MGQAWCKERATKAQDSKSPLDRVLVRCAHQIYPSLKEDGGSVLGGATQRVTSSEIGYAGSPPREILTRGRSMDSVDRPFHPSEWVDVNLEVPSTPSSVITNLTANASRYPTTTATTTTASATTTRTTTTTTTTTTTLSSTEWDSKYVAPIPPPRHRRKNRGRPLPPKPDEIPETHEIGKSLLSPKKDEPLYSSVKPKHKDASNGESVEEKIVEKRIETIGAKNESVTDVPGKLTEEISRKRRSKDIQEHGVNGSIERTIADSRRARGDRREDSVDQGFDGSKSIGDVVGYDRFAESEEIRSSSTPRDSKVATELREYVSGATIGGGDILDVIHHRPKNHSTISLPSYDELESVKSVVERIDETSKEEENVAPKKPGRTRNVSTISLPPESISQRTTERLADYISRCRSFGSLQPEEIIEKLKSQSEMDDGSSDEDDWDDLDDWDIDHAEHGAGHSDGRSPVEPSSRVARRGKCIVPRFELGGEPMLSEDGEPGFRRIVRNASFELPKSPDALKPALKDEAKRKTSMPPKFPSREADSSLEEWFTAQERSVRFFDPPPAEDEYANAPGHRPSKLKLDVEPADTYDPRTRSYNGIPRSPFDIDTFFEDMPTFGEAIGKTESGAVQSEKVIRKVLTRSLSNESEPYDGYEEKELTLDIRSQSSMGGGGGGDGGDGGDGITKTISAESIPREMERENRSARSEDSRTPPSSPEPKMLVEIQEASVVGRGASKRVKDEEGGSNLSSMTPSLTELEAALSDMLEKEDHDGVPEDVSGPATGGVEPKTLPSCNDSRIHDNNNDNNSNNNNNKNSNNNHNKNNNNNNNNDDEIIDEGRCRKRATSEKISLEQILNDRSSPERRVASRMTDELLKVAFPVKSTPKNPFEEDDDEEEAKFEIVEAGSHPINPFDEPPEKPSRLQKFLVDRVSRLDVPDVPAPPRRKNKHGGDHHSKNLVKSVEDVRGSTEFPIASSAPHPNDRLI